MKNYIKQLFIFSAASLLLLLFSCEEEPVSSLNTENTNLENQTIHSKTLPYRFQYFYRGRSGSQNTIYTSYSNNGISNWQGNRKLNNRSNMKKSFIAATVYNGKVFVAHKGASNSNKIYTSFSYDGINFSNDRVVNNGARTSGNIEMITFKNQLFMYYKGQSNNKINYSRTSTFNGSSWNGNRRVDNDNYFDFDVVKSADGERLYLLDLIANNRILVKMSTDGINFNTIHTENYTGRGITGISVTINKHKDEDDNNDEFIILLQRNTSTNNKSAFYTVRCNSNFSVFEAPLPVKTSATSTIAQTEKKENTGSIASDGDTIVVAFEEFYGSRVFTAYSTDSGQTWIGNRAALGETKNSGVELIYLR